MTDKIINLTEYRARLDQIKAEAEQEKDEAKRAMMLAIYNWINNFKWKEFEESRKKAGAAFDELYRIDPTGQLLSLPQPYKDIIIDHYDMLGRIDYIFEAVRVFESEGSEWKTGVQPTEKEKELLSELDKLMKKDDD